MALNETISPGDPLHHTLHSQERVAINALLAASGIPGDPDYAQWLYILPDDLPGYGFIIRCNTTDLLPSFGVEDSGENIIFSVLPSGGAGVSSANATADGLWVSNDVTGRTAFLNTNGGLRLAKGDPGAGIEVLALGDATTAPSLSPDGTHTAETSFTTVAGAVIWGPVGSGGRLRWRNRAGHEDELSAPLLRRQMAVSAPGGGSTLTVIGTAAPTVASTNITAVSDDTASGAGVSYTTTAAASVDAGVISAFGLVQPRWGPVFFARVMTDGSAITSTRLAAGLVTAEIATNAGPAASAAYTTAAGAFFRYDTGVDGTAFWRCVTGDAANATVTTTTTAIAAATSYELLIECNSAGTAWRFTINGAVVATHSTNLPSTSAALGYIARLRTLTTSARALRLGHLRVTSR